MSSWLDIVGSFIVGAFIVLIVSNINLVIASSSSEILFSNIEQYKLSNSLNTMEQDFDKIGYQVTGEKISLAEKRKIKFKADIDDDGSAESLYYYRGTKSEMSSTQNPNDRPLYRSIGGQNPLNIGSITDFVVSYYDSTGQKLSYSSLQNSSVRERIRSVQIYIKVESPELVDSVYQGAEWQRKISPKNL